MDAIDLLQQLGLNKYEAEAYYALLAEGPLTGYELGKRSPVPLSRSYEILERLTQKGLALQQPGDPPRYAAEDHARVLGQMRYAFTQTLDALAATLATLPRHDTAGEFWVLRGRQPILSRLRALITGAQRSLDLSLPAAYGALLGDVLARAPAAGCRIVQPASSAADADEIVLALADDREVLLGTLAPAAQCQAIAGANLAMLAVLRRHFAMPPTAMSHDAAATADDTRSWLDWEERKQRRLWRVSRQDRSA